MLTVFNFNTQKVRVFNINGQPWFVGRDICAVLDITNTGNAFSRLRDYEKDIRNMDTLGGNQEMTIISESGLYRLILTSRKPQAEVFQDWVCQEVLPSIRKSGSYSVQQPELPKTYLEALKALVASEEQKLLLEAQNQKLNEKITQDAPLVQYAQAVQYSESCVDFQEFAKIIKNHGGRNTVMRKAREMGILMKNSTLPYQKYLDAGYFEVSQEIDEQGRLIPFALVTGKGQIWLHQKLIAHDNLTQKAINAIANSVLSFSFS